MVSSGLAQKMAVGAQKSYGQRREVTVLFVDVANFTATTNAIESEEAFHFINEMMRLLVEVTHKYEGSVDKFTGDGMMALFGAPVSHENDPERAVRAALEMQDVVAPVQARLAQSHGFDLRIRIGINTGTVIAGRLGNDLHMEYTVIGDTVNLASRLESAAKPGTVLVSYATYQRTRPLFHYRILPPISVKGFAGTIRANQPLRVREQPGSLRGLPGLQVPMIGRNDAAQQLRHALDTMLETGHVQVALVTADAGLGKSRLVTEFSRSLQAISVNYYQGGCITYARSRPMWVVAEMLRDIIGLSENEPKHHQWEKVRAYLQQLGLNEEEDLPYMLHVLGLPQRDEEISNRLSLMDAGMLQTQTHAILRQFILREASLNPLVLTFEDLHWVDPASRSFLEHLLQTVDDAALMLVLVSRQLERATVIKSLVETVQEHPERFTDIQLSPLNQQDTEAMIDHLIAEHSSEATRLKDEIVRRAGGIPFYMEEIVRMLMEQDGLVQADDVWQTTPQAAKLLDEVPATVKGLILTRADRLPSDLYRCLQRAAVCGRSFPMGLLQSLNGYTPEQIQQQVDELVKRQFLLPESFGTEQGYTFRHDLILGTLYGTLMQRDRRHLHEKVADTIEHTNYWTPDEQMEVLAYHYSESANIPKAIQYLLLAAENAARRHAHEIAIQHFEQAAELMRMETEAQDERFIQIWTGLGQALKFAGEFSRAGEMLLRSLDYLNSPNWPDTFRVFHLVHTLRELADLRIREGSLEQASIYLQDALTSLDTGQEVADPDLLQSLLDRSAWVRFRQGKLDEAFMLAQNAVDTQKTYAKDGEPSSANPAVQASLFNTLGGISWQRGHLSDATEYVKKSLNMHEAVNYIWGMAIANTNLGVLYFSRGLWAKALTHFELAHQLHRDNGYLPEQALNLTNLGQLRASMGDHAGARHDYEASLAMSERMGDEFAVLQAQVGLAHICLTESDVAQADEHMQVAESLLSAAGTDQSIQLKWMRAQILGIRGLPAEGRDLAMEALDMAKEAGLVGAQADCGRILGSLYAQLGQWTAAESKLQDAVALSRQHNDRYRQAQSLMELGKLYEQMGDNGQTTGAPDVSFHQARVGYQSAHDLFAELQANWDLEQARIAQQRITHTARTTRGLDGQWHRAAILSLHLHLPAQDQESADELRFEISSHLKPALLAIIDQHKGRYQEQEDGLLVFFGIPASFEDDAVRCVTVALQMRSMVATYARENRLTLAVTLAATYGEVVAGGGRRGSNGDLIVTGAPLLDVAALGAAVPHGQFWVTGSIQSAARHKFSFSAPTDPLPPTVGQDGVFEVTGVRQFPSLRRGLYANSVQLVGRNPQMKAMLTLAQNIQAGNGGLIWLGGEAGIGKSRIMRDFGENLARSGARVWEGYCSVQRKDSAFSLFSSLFRTVFDIQMADRPERIREKIQQVMESWPEGCRQQHSAIEILMGLQPTTADLHQLAGLDPNQLRQQLFVAVRRIVRAFTAQAPMVMLLDDVQWIDPVSAELLLFLVNMVEDTPMIFVCTYRSGETDLPDPNLERARSLDPKHTLRLELEHLSPADSRLFLGELLPNSTLPDGLVQEILDHSGGNPYFIEEYVRMLLEQEFLVRGASTSEKLGDLQVNPRMDMQHLPLPQNLQTLLRSRFDSLPPIEQSLLQVSAVIGNPVDLRLLSALTGESRAATIFQRLQKRHLVEPAANAGLWRFSHSMMETVVYQSMLRSDRRRIHLEVASTLELQLGSTRDEYADTLAYHFTQADRPDKALTYLVLSGERAATHYSNKEALVYFTQAHTLLTDSPEIPCSVDICWRMIVGLANVKQITGQHVEAFDLLTANEYLADDPSLSTAQRAAFRRLKGQVLEKQSKMAEAWAHYNQAMALLDPPNESQDKIEMARLLHSMAWSLYLKGDFEEGLETGRQCVEQAQATGAINVVAKAHNVLGGIYTRMGLLDKALDHMQKAMDLRQKTGYTWGVASGMSNLGVLAVLTGDWRRAKRFFQRSLVLSQEVGNVEGQVIVLNNLGMLNRDQGTLDEAETFFRQGIAIAANYHMGYQLANTSMGLAMTLNLAGRPVEALDLVRGCMTQAAVLGAKDVTIEGLRITAESYLSQEHWQEARSTAMAAAEQAREIGNPGLTSAAWRIISESELALGNLSEAEAACQQAVLASQNVNELLEIGRVDLQRARVEIAKNAPERARPHLLAARDIFSRIRASLDLEWVDALLEKIESAAVEPIGMSGEEFSHDTA